MTHAEKLARVALNQVSHDADGRCLWCRRAEHKPDCLREAAMRLLSPPLEVSNGTSATDHRPSAR